MKTMTYQQTKAAGSRVPIFDEPLWLLGAGDGFVPNDLEEFHFSDRITVVGTLKPCYVESKVTGHYQDNSGMIFSSAPLYDDGVVLSRIEWVADWIEQPDGAAEALEVPFVWGMDFKYHKQNIVACYTLPSIEQPGFWKETQSIVEPVWSWGGVYTPGCALGDIRLRYFSVLPGGVKNDNGRKIADTQIAKMGAINPRYQVLCGATDAESAQINFQPVSFLNHIQFGSIHYSLPHVVDDVGYRSSEVVDYDAANGRVKILFLRRNHGNNLT